MYNKSGMNYHAIFCVLLRLPRAHHTRRVIYPTWKYLSILHNEVVRKCATTHAIYRSNTSTYHRWMAALDVMSAECGYYYNTVVKYLSLASEVRSCVRGNNCVPTYTYHFFLLDIFIYDFISLMWIPRYVLGVGC